MTTSTRPLLPRPTDAVRQPIINSPYYPPEYHWDLDYSAKAIDNVLDGRRLSQNIPPVAGSRKTRGRVTLPGQFGAVWTPLDLVNDIRAAVSTWQDEGFPGITQTSRDLINHWTDSEACQPYFAQTDAVLTHIYLQEAATEELKERVREINLRPNDGIHRIAQIILVTAFLIAVATMACASPAATLESDSASSSQQPEESGPALLLDEESAISILQTYLQECVISWDEVYAEQMLIRMHRATRAVRDSEEWDRLYKRTPEPVP